MSEMEYTPGAQVIMHEGSKVMTYWPYCHTCQKAYHFDPNEPFAQCDCGTTEWGDPRPAPWVVSPHEMRGGGTRPGVVKCAKCKFVLNRVILNMGSGTVGAGNSDTEPCPNGCGPLWPVTWQQYADMERESCDRMVDLWDGERAKNQVLLAALNTIAEFPLSSVTNMDSANMKKIAKDALP